MPPKALLTIIGAACTSQNFRYLLFHKTEAMWALYPDLKKAMSADDMEAFNVLVAPRGFPNPIELAIAKVHALFIAADERIHCSYPSCPFKLDPTEEQMIKALRKK